MVIKIKSRICISNTHVLKLDNQQFVLKIQSLQKILTNNLLTLID